MHNWRLLLFAFLAVLQPIASFTERNLVDGREQCCSRDSLLRDSNLAYGTRVNKLSGDHSLSREIREDRRYEVRREDPVLNRASFDRRLVEFRSERDVRRFSPEPTRFMRAELRREHVADIRRERTSASRDDRERRLRDTQKISSRDISRDMRERDVARMRYSREDVRQQERDPRESSRARATREGSRFSRNLDTENRFRVSLESRRETRIRSRNNSKEHRIQEIRQTRDVLQRTRADVTHDKNTRARQDRRVARERTDERRAQSESRLQVDNSKERRSLERRVRETVEDRRSKTTDRVRDIREKSLLNRDKKDARELNYRRTVSERLNERRTQRDERRESRQRSVSDRRESRDRTVTERRDARDSDRARIDFRNIRLEHTVARREERRVKSHDVRAASENQRAESRRMMDREARHRDTERRDYPATDRIDISDNERNVRLISNRFLEIREREVSLTRDHRLAKLMERDTRFRSNPELIRIRETVASIRKIPDQPSAMNWQYVLYTLQGIYLCGVLMQLLTQKESDKKPRALTWLLAPRSLVKMD